jgi:hypothetical protein
VLDEKGKVLDEKGKVLDEKVAKLEGKRSWGEEGEGSFRCSILSLESSACTDQVGTRRQRQECLEFEWWWVEWELQFWYFRI